MLITRLERSDGDGAAGGEEASTQGKAADAVAVVDAQEREDPLAEGGGGGSGAAPTQQDSLSSLERALLGEGAEAEGLVGGASAETAEKGKRKRISTPKAAGAESPKKRKK